MKTKTKLFIVTSVGAVFAAAIAFVTFTGARNLAELHAGSGKTSKLEISNFAKTSLDEWDSDNTRAYFTLTGTTELSKDVFSSTTGTYAYVMSESNVVFGTNEDDFYVKAIDEYCYGGCATIYIDFFFEGPGVVDQDSSVIEVEVKKYDDYQKSAFSTRTEYVKFEYLEDESTTYMYFSYSTDYLEEYVAVKSIKVTYTC